MHLHDPDRLAAIDRTGLVDQPPVEAFDRAARLVARVLGVPVAHTTLVLDERQFYPSQIGLPEPFATDREMSLDASFCKHVVVSEDAFVVPDTSAEPLVAENPAVTEFGVGAYCGVPLVSADGFVIGAVCGLQFEPRDWLDEDVALLRDIASQLRSELLLRAELAALRDDRDRGLLVGLVAAQLDRTTQGLLDAFDEGERSVRDMRDRVGEALRTIRELGERLAVSRPR